MRVRVIFTVRPFLEGQAILWGSGCVQKLSPYSKGQCAHCSERAMHAQDMIISPKLTVGKSYHIDQDGRKWRLMMNQYFLFTSA